MLNNSLPSPKYSHSYTSYSKFINTDSQHSVSSSVIYSHNQFVEEGKRDSRLQGDYRDPRRSYFPQDLSPGRSHYSPQSLSPSQQYLFEMPSPVSSGFGNFPNQPYEEQEDCSVRRQNLEEHGYMNYEQGSPRERTQFKMPFNSGQWTGYEHGKDSIKFEKASPPIIDSERVNKTVQDESLNYLNTRNAVSLSPKIRDENQEQRMNEVFEMYKKRRHSAPLDFEGENKSDSKINGQFDSGVPAAKRFRPEGSERQSNGVSKTRTSHQILQRILQDGTYHVGFPQKSSGYMNTSSSSASMESQQVKSSAEPVNNLSPNFITNGMKKYDPESARNDQTYKYLVDIERLLQCDRFLDISDLFSIDELFGSTKEAVTKTLCTLGDKIVSKLVEWMKQLPFYREIPIEVHSESLSNKWNELILLITTAYKAVRGARIKGVSTEQLYQANMKQLQVCHTDI